MPSRRPQMLKDFLTDDSNSCLSSEPTVRNLLDLESRSKSASTMTIYAIHKASEMVFNAVKYLSVSSVKSPSVLPRSISRKLSGHHFWNKRRNDDVKQVSVKVVKVKDILRWRSFRDLIEEIPPPLDLSSPQRCTTTTTTTESSNSSSSSNSSWCDSDFTAEDLPSLRRYSHGKNCLPDDDVGGDLTTVNPKVEFSCEENEQYSPVSVLNFPFQEESFLSFHQSLATLQSRKNALMQKIQHFESLAKLEATNLEHRFSLEEEDDGDHEEYVKEGNETEDEAMKLMNLVKAESSVGSCEAHEDQLLLDFFKHELATSRNKKIDDDFDCEMLREAKAWMIGQYDESFEWDEERKREAYVRDMEGGVRWSKFEEEQEELAMEMETRLLNYLVDDLVVDLSCSLKTKQAKIICGRRVLIK